jgi:hypothetical protein
MLDAFDDAAALKADPGEDKAAKTNSWEAQAAVAERLELLSQVIRFVHKHDPGLTRSQKVQRIVNRVFSDDLAEDKLDAILSEIEEISVRAK